jgi:hypothetical protein
MIDVSAGRRGGGEGHWLGRLTPRTGLAMTDELEGGVAVKGTGWGG